MTNFPRECTDKSANSADVALWQLGPLFPIPFILKLIISLFKNSPTSFFICCKNTNNIHIGYPPSYTLKKSVTSVVFLVSHLRIY